MAWHNDPKALEEHKRRVALAAGSTQDGLTPAQRQYRDAVGQMFQHLDAPPKPAAPHVNPQPLRLPSPDQRIADQGPAFQRHAAEVAARNPGHFRAPQAAVPPAAPRPQMPAAPQPRIVAQPAIAPGRQPSEPIPVAPPQQAQHGRQAMFQPFQQALHQPGPSMLDEHAKQYQDSIAATNQSIADEMQSRVDQARDWDKMQHEENLAAMSHQADMQKLNFERETQNQMLARRDARNAALLNAAGFGQTLVNGRPVDPFSSIRSSLLG